MMSKALILERNQKEFKDFVRIFQQKCTYLIFNSLVKTKKPKIEIQKKKNNNYKMKFNKKKIK